MKTEACEMWIVSEGFRLTEEVGPDGLTWVCAKPGAVFEIEFVNSLSTRLLAVAAVDGLSIQDGKPHSPASSGYIIEPGSTARIPGWRLDDQHVARFEFGSSAKGYAQQMGYSPQNVGAIVCDFLDEVVKAPPQPAVIEVPPRSNPLPPPQSQPNIRYSIVSDVRFRISGAGLDLNNERGSILEGLSKTLTDDIAVAFGKKIVHGVVTKAFERAAVVRQRLEIHYDTSRGLRNRGVGCEPPPGWLHKLFN